jgi:cholesterol oxidase
MATPMPECFDYVIVGSGFGGSVSALRLTEKGYRVLVLERGKRFRDQDFAKSNWNVFKYVWFPFLRCFGILQISPFRDVFALHGSGVGGGSLGYANVLMVPSDKLFAAPAWSHLADWKAILQPHYVTAKRMLGVTPNPCLWPADFVMQDVAAELKMQGTFQPTEVGAYFGTAGKTVPDPYFGGEGPDRTGCIHCGGCMVGCRHGAKNTLVKNYLYLAEKWGAQVWPETEVRDVRPLPPDQPDGARYEVIYRRATAVINPLRAERVVRARHVIFSAGALGTLRLLFRCRDVTRSLPRVSQQLGNLVRTNSEALLGSTARELKTNYSEGIAITSIFNADDVTTVEPVRYPAGSSLMRFLAGPLVDAGGRVIVRFFKTVAQIFTRPRDFAKTHILPGWAQRSTIILVMQTEDNRIRLRLGRSVFTAWRKNLVSRPDTDHTIPSKIDIGHEVTRKFSAKINGIPLGSLNEGLLNIPMTAHILGGVPFGLSDQDGVIGLNCEIHNYPGLFVVDGSIMPANPGVNPSLTITALAEYAMSCQPEKAGAPVRPPIGIAQP